MTILIHDGHSLHGISYWGETLNNPEEVSDAELEGAEHAYYIPGLDENGKPINVEVVHTFWEGFHQYIAPRLYNQKFFFEGSRIGYYSCVTESHGPRHMLKPIQHQCQVWKDPLFQRTCRGFATKAMFKLLEQQTAITADCAQTWDGMNLCLNFLQYAINYQNYNCFYALADRKFDKEGNEIPTKTYLVKVETLADVFGHYCQHIMGDDPVFVYRIAGATLKDKPVESVLANPDETEVLTCKEAEDRGLFNEPQPMSEWPKAEKEEFSKVYFDI